MFTHISLTTLWVTDQDAAKAFYIDKLGFVEKTDLTMGEGFRWVTIVQPDHPELEVTLMIPGPPLDDQMAEAVRRSLASGTMGGFGLATDDCRKAYDDLSAQGSSSPSRRRTGRTASRRSCGTTRATGWCWSSRRISVPRTSAKGDP